MKKKHLDFATRVLLILYSLDTFVLPYGHLALHASHDPPGGSISFHIGDGTESCAANECNQRRTYANRERKHQSSHTSEVCSLCKITQTGDSIPVLTPLAWIIHADSVNNFITY